LPRHLPRDHGRWQNACVIGSRGGTPVRIKDVAQVTEGTDLQTDAATPDGEETVLGTAMLLIGENSRAVPDPR
jgi:cobalt-zinc-cadmium resistance protein CzcA